MKLLLFILAATGASISLANVSAFPERYCNPLPLPDYPVGVRARDLVRGEPAEANGLWLLDRKEQFRELADPSALWHEGKWYLYPSVRMAFVSEDEGRTWRSAPLNVPDIGYAPSIVKHGGRFLLIASESDLYSGPTPLGPFEKIGPLQIPKVPGIPGQGDPMLFSDDDGRLFYFWGCTPRSGIWGVELDAANPTRAIGEPREMIPFAPDTYPWERLGNWNQDPNLGWMEGGWMVKHGGRYYLTYSAGGTQWRTYAMGCYVSDSPLGPFTPQKRNPMFRTTDGLITGSAHGCVVAGPRDSLWTFYTVFAGVAHGFERRVGMDIAAIDEHGELYVPAATSMPHALPSAGGEAAPAWLPLNDGDFTIGSSTAPNLPGRFAVDNSMLTWWQPAAEDRQPILTTRFSNRAAIHAVRVIWRDVGLDTPNGVVSGPIRYRIEAETAKDTWTTIIDRNASAEDFLIDYRECEPTSATRARIVIVGAPEGITPAVAEFTVFGITERTRS
jgi:xylan 1,4-beta-xylosidase